MKERLRKIAKWIVYPLFYLFCLLLFGYLTFPYDQLKDRLIAEFEHQQSKRGQASGQRLEIDELSSYWFSGVKATGVRLIMPPDDSPGAKATGLDAALAKAGMAGPAEPAKDSVLTIDEAHARVRVLPLLIGRVKIDFWAKAFGGQAEGVIPVGASAGPVEVEIEDVELGLVEPLVQMIGLPIKGTAKGKLELTASEGKFNKANGLLELTVTDVSVGDGKTKFKGQVALPEAKLGDLSISAEATSGVLKITKLSSTGPDIELVGDGKVAVREPWNDSTADMYLRFKFSDAYRDKNEDTRSLLGSPGSSMPALIEILEPKVKRAKRQDGFYGFHIHGPLKKMKFDPSTVDSAGAKPARTKGADSPFTAPKKPGGVQLPLGTSTAMKEEPAVPPQPTPEPAAENPPESPRREREREEAPSAPSRPEPEPVPAPAPDSPREPVDR